MKLINNLIIKIIPFLPRFFVRIVASPYIAGISDEEMLKKVKNLNDRGLSYNESYIIKFKSHLYKNKYVYGGLSLVIIATIIALLS